MNEIDVFVIFARAFDPITVEVVGAEGYVCSLSNVTDESDKFAIVLTPYVNIEVGTVVFVSRRRAQEVRDRIAERFVAHTPNLIGEFTIQQKTVPVTDYQIFLQKGYLFEGGTI